jgi:ATP-dependent Clp protease ATP-binding subunit ClpA
MIAGTKYRGQFEQRFQGLLDELKENSNFIIFIDGKSNLAKKSGSAKFNGDIINCNHFLGYKVFGNGFKDL